MPLNLCKCGLARHAVSVQMGVIYECEHCDRPCMKNSGGACQQCRALSIKSK